MFAVLIPIKNLNQAKKRLAAVLDANERRRLVRTMLGDVASSLEGFDGQIDVFAVSADRWVGNFAARRGWEWLRESDQTSESFSVDWASERLQRQGVDRLLRLPGDIPLLRAEDIRCLLERGRTTPAAVAVPSADGTGTNALLRCPPTAFPSRFGPGSLQLHRLEAEKRKIAFDIVSLPRVALDLDTVGDLLEFEKRGHKTLTWKMLSESKVFQRLRSHTDALS